MILKNDINMDIKTEIKNMNGGMKLGLVGITNEHILYHRSLKDVIFVGDKCKCQLVDFLSTDHPIITADFFSDDMSLLLDRIIDANSKKLLEKYQKDVINISFKMTIAKVKDDLDVSEFDVPKQPRLFTLNGKEILPIDYHLVDGAPFMKNRNYWYFGFVNKLSCVDGNEIEIDINKKLEELKNILINYQSNPIVIDYYVELFAQQNNFEMCKNLLKYKNNE